MFYSVEADMANYRGKSSQPSKLDGCVNQHRHKITKDLLYHGDEDSLDYCKLKGIITALMKYIEDAPMKLQYSIDFAKDVRKKLLCLHYDISRFLKHNKEFPFSSELHNLLVRYVEFEHDILYHPKNFSKEYQKVVEQQILYLLQSIFYDPIGIRKTLLSSPEEASAINTVYILKNLKPEIRKSQSLINSMMVNLLSKLNVLDEFIEMRKKDRDLNFDKILGVSRVQTLHKYLTSRNYYNKDDFHNSDDEFDMEIVNDIKQEIKVERNQSDDIELVISSNQQCITIDLDSDSEDCHSLDVRKNTLDSNIKRVHTSTNISKHQLNSFTTSNICDNKRFHLNSDKFPVLNLCDNENRFSNSSNYNLSNYKSAFPHNKIQNGTTRRNVVNETNSDQDASLHNMIYDDLKYNNFHLKKELLLLDNDEHLCIPSKLYDVTEKLKRYIDECPKSVRYTKRFVNGIHRTLIYLYESMCRLVKGSRDFLLSTELHALLVTYFELEYEVLYDSKNFSTQYEEIVQSRILHLFVNILFNPTVDRSIKEYVKSSEEASLLSTLYVVRSIKPEYKKQHPLVENILNKLMSKLNVLDKINELKSKNKNVEFHQLLTIPQFNKIYKYLHYRDCYGMACNSSEDSMDMGEVKPSIKNEEIDVKPDVCTHYHLDKRKPLVIDVDEEDDDCFMICDIRTQRNETVVKAEENSSQNLFDNVLIKAETNCNNSKDYSSNLSNKQNNLCIIIDDSDEEEGSCLLEESNPTMAHMSNITDALEEELLQLEDADSDIKSEDENEVLNRFTDDECDANEKIGKSCGSVQKNKRSGSSNRKTIILDQKLTSEEVETSNDTSKTNDSLLQNEASIEVLEDTVSHSCSSTENIDTTMTSEEIHKSIDSPSLTNNEINHKVTESNNCSSEITVDLNLISHVNFNLDKNLADNVNIGEVTSTALKSANEDLAIEKDIHFLASSTSILNIPSNTESSSLSRNDVPDLNIKIPDIEEEIQHTISISEDKDLNLNIQNLACQLNVEVDKLYENDINLEAANEDIQVQHSTSNTECLEEFIFTSKDSSKNLNEQDKRDNLNLEIDDPHNDKSYELQKDNNSKTSMLLNVESIVQDNQLTEIDQQIYNKSPKRFAEIVQVFENQNLNVVGDEISVTPESSDLVESEVVSFQEKKVEDVCEDTQLLENEINTISEGLELFENEESIIHTDLEKNIEVICDKSDLSENYEQSGIVAIDYDKEIVVTVESINTIGEKEVHLALEEDSESIDSEFAIVQTENDQSEAVSTVHKHSIEHEQQSIEHTEIQVFCETSNSNENAELNTIEHLEVVHTELDVVADDLKEELCVLEDQIAQSKKEAIDDLQSTVVEHLEVQKIIEVTSENEEILEDEPNASKSSFNFQNNDYVKETTNNKDIIEDYPTQELHIEIQNSITKDNKDCKEGLKRNMTFENSSKNKEILEDEPTTSKSSFNFQDNDYVKESTNKEDIIEDDATQELHIEIQDPIANDDDNEECKEGIKSNVTFDNPSNFLGVLAQVASEQRKLYSLEMENKSKRKAVTKKANLNKRKQNIINKKKLKKGSVAVRRVTRSSSLKAKENLDVEADFCKFPSNFMNLENFVSPPPNRVYDLIIPIASMNEESVDGSDCDQINQQFGDAQLNTFLINNSIFDEDTIEDGIEFVCHKRKNNKIEPSISKCIDGEYPVQEIHDDNIFNIEEKSKSDHLESLEDTSLNFQIKTSETFTQRDINNQFNVNLLLDRDEENKLLKTKSKPSANKKNKKVKSNLKCAELCVNNEELDSCRNVKRTSNKNKRSKLEQNAEKKLNKTKNQKLCVDGVSIKTKGNKSSVDEVHVPYENAEEIIVQNTGIENVAEAELEFEVITEETYESSDLQINAEIVVPNNGEVGKNIAINKISVINDIDLSSSNSVSSKNHEEECLPEVEMESATNDVSNNFQKQANTKQESENSIDLKTQEKYFVPENDVIDQHGEIVDNEHLKLNKSTKLRKSKVIKGHGKERKTTERKYKGEKKESDFKIIKDLVQAKINDSPLPITDCIKSSKIIPENVRTLQRKNMKTNKQKLLKSNKFQSSSRSNIQKYTAKNNLSKKLGISKSKKNMITKKRIKFLRESLKRTVRRDRIKRERADSLKKEQVEVKSNIEIPKTKRDKNSTENLIKTERTKKKRPGKKSLLKDKFLIEENWICSPIEQELSKNVIDTSSKPSENSIEDTTITKNNQELNVMKEAELSVSNNLQLQVNSALIENDCIDKVTENEELTNTEMDQVQVLENVTVNFDYEEIVEQPKILKSIENETIRIENQLTDVEEPSKDIKNTTVEGCTAVTECITKVISDVDILEEPCEDIQNTISVKNSNITIEEPDNITTSTNIHEESNIDELLKNDLPNMNTLVEEIKTKKRKLSESEHVQDQEEQFATKEHLVIQLQIESCKITSKATGKISKRILRSSKTDSKSKDINSVTEKLRSRNYQKIKKDTTVKITKADIEMNSKKLKEENTEIVRIGDKRNRVKKQTTTISEKTEVDDNKINSKVEKEANTSFEITKVDDIQANLKVEKEVMMTDGNESNQEVETVINTTCEITEVDYNTANQEVNKEVNRTCEISELDNKNTNKEVEQEYVTSEITKVVDNTEINAISDISNVSDNKTNEEIEESYTTSEGPNNIKKSTFIEINVTKTNGDELEESSTTFASSDELKKNELMEIVEVDHTVISDNISKEDDTIAQNSNLKLVVEVDKNEANEKIETILPRVEEDNEKVAKETFENAKGNCIEIAEVDHVEISSLSPEETNCIEIAEADNIIINSKLLDETNITNCIEIAKVDDFEINSTSADEANITNGKEITETDNLKVIIKSPDVTNTTNGMEIAETEDMKINSKLSDETKNSTGCIEEAEADDVEINCKPLDEMNTTTSMESAEADNVNVNSKSPNEANPIDGMEIAEADDLNINSESPEDTNVTLKYLKITEDNSKIDEKTLEDTTYKNLNKFEKDLMENSDLDNNVVQFSMDLEKTSKDADNLPTTVEEINMLNESADNDNRDHKINEQDFKCNESLNEDNLLDVHGDVIKEGGNYCEKVVETEQNLTSDKMEIHKEISKECENFDKEECENANEVQKDFSSNDFEFPKNLNESVADSEIQATKDFVSSPTETLHASPKNDYSVTSESEYAIEEVTIQSSILSPKHLQHIVDSVKNIPTTEILEEIVDCHGLLNSKCFEDSILVYSEQMKEPMGDNCILQIANETTVETSQVTPSTSLSDTSPNFLQAMFSHQFQIGKILYLKGSDHNYHSVSDPLLSAKYGATNENDRSLNHSKEIALPTPELESEDNIMQFISTQSEGNLNQELSTSLNEASVNTSADFQLLDQCLMENGLGHESSPPLPQRVSCDNVFQNTLNQEVTEYDDISRNSNLEFRESNEEVNIDSFQQNEMSTEKMIELMSVLADIKHLNNISSGTAPFDAEVNNYNQQYKLQYPEQMQKSYEDIGVATTTLNTDFGETSNTSGFTNKLSSELEESPTKLIRDIFEAASAIEHSDSIPISKSISFDTDFYFSGIQDTFPTRDNTSNNKVIVERIPHIPHELAKCTNVVDISTALKDNEFKASDAHHTINVPKISVTTPKKKFLTSSESHPKFTLQLQPKINKSSMDKLLLDHCLKRQSTRTKLVAPKKKQLNEVPKKPDIFNAKTNNELKIETINKVKLDKDESLTRSCNELDLKKISSRRVSGKTRIVNDVTKDGKCSNATTTLKKEDAISKKEDESKTGKNFNKEVTSYLKDLDKLVVENQNTTKESSKKSVLKSGCTTTDSHSQTINFTISPPQQKVKDNFDQALSKNDLLDNVKFRKRKPVDYVEKSERKKNCSVNKKLPYKGNQKKVELEDSSNKIKGKRKLEQSDDKDVKIKNKYHETEENKLPNLSDNLLQQKEKSLEDSDDNILRKKKPRLGLPESNPTDAVFDRLLKEGNVNDNDISNNSTNNYSNRNPVSLPTYEHFTPIIHNADSSMVNLQKSTSNSISIFNTGVQRTIDNKPKKIAIVAPIKSNVKKEPPPMCSRSLYNKSEEYHNMKGHHVYYASSSSSKSRHHYSSRESSRSRHPESSSSRRREYQIDRKQPSSRTNKTSEHDWLDKMKHAFPQEFTNEVSFEYERGNDISRSTHQH